MCECPLFSFVVRLNRAAIAESLTVQGGGLFRGLEESVKAAQDGHGQNNVAVLASDVEVAQDVVCDPPDQAHYFVMLCVVQ